MEPLGKYDSVFRFALTWCGHGYLDSKRYLTLFHFHYN